MSAEDAQDLDPIDPALEAALARDGASMAQLARLTGLDYRTIRRWTDGHQAVADVVAGRARLVRLVGGAPGEEARSTWVLERLADRGVAPVEVARVAGVLDEAVGQLWGMLPHLQKRTETGLQDDASDTITVGMNAHVLKSVAADVWKRTRGEGFVSLHKRVPRDQAERLEETAARLGMDSSDLIRAMLETHLPPLTGT